MKRARRLAVAAFACLAGLAGHAGLAGLAGLAACGEPPDPRVQDAQSVPRRMAGPVPAAAAGSAPAASPEPGGGEPSALDGLLGADHFREGVFTWTGPAERQQLFGTNFRDFQVLDEVRDAAGEWTGRRHSRRADFDALLVASACKDVFALAGRAENGDFVLQRWTLRPVDASGGADGLLEKRFEVTEIHRGPTVQAPRGLDFDAEQRFVLLLGERDGSATLYAFENAAGATPTVLTDAQRLPALAAMNTLQKFEHRSLGRVWRLEDFPAQTAVILLVDAENDGRFDGEPRVFDRAAWQASGLDEYDLWDPLTGP